MIDIILNSMTNILRSETIFRFILPTLIIIFVAHRGYYTKKHDYSTENTVKQRREGPATRLAGILSAFGLLAMLVYVINPTWMAWTNLSFPIWLRWIGVGVTILGFILLQWAQNTLGKNWSDTPRLMKDQALVTAGPYHWIRHPIYTAFLLILGSTFFISANWMIGLCWFGMSAMEIISRIGFEEALMLESFGDQYREYMNRTGRFLPKIV
jgi:protein-S-isoprenylcysteine O-methyltransferase Ste14